MIASEYEANIEAFQKASQEEVKVSQEEMKSGQEELNTKLENKLKEFEEVVEEEINKVKEEVKAVEGEFSHMKEDKKEINKKIEDLETKFRQFSTTGKQVKYLRLIVSPSGSLAEISNRSPTFKGYWTPWDSFAIENILLNRVWESPDGKERNYQTVLPRKKVPEVLQAVHSGVGGGHFGINKTLDKVRERFYWLGSRSDVEEQDPSKICIWCITAIIDWFDLRSTKEREGRGQLHQSPSRPAQTDPCRSTTKDENLKPGITCEPIQEDSKLVRRFGCTIRRGPKESHQCCRSDGRDPTLSSLSCSGGLSYEAVANRKSERTEGEDY
ncbi:hypothetical protein NQ315_016461 [Exocentrus adspersus]|uniref:Integrase zinc-binding domain-containing protein n=1 Tax=Exocentrus adspersus TaxID=1586481 RepID=A0AAV8VYS6_9CUCU|nr:hypothetical protein NQ315_016461 [Exocentrus adspersus]